MRYPNKEIMKQDKMGKVTELNVVEKARGTEPSLMAAEVKETKRAAAVEEREAKSKQEEAAFITCAGEERERAESGKVQDEKAAKIRRLKSGFRICKPQGTFLWPNMVKDNTSTNTMMMSSTPQVFVQVEVPTPPSVSSSTTTAPRLLFPTNHHHYQPAVVKPLAEKRAVTVTVSTLPSKPQNHAPPPPPLVDLNDAPPNLNDLPLQAYGARKVMGYDEMNACCCSSSATSLPPPPPPTGAVNWLALSSLKSASDDSSPG